MDELPNICIHYGNKLDDRDIYRRLSILEKKGDARYPTIARITKICIAAQLSEIEKEVFG
jgi:hypothetical protein